VSVAECRTTVPYYADNSITLWHGNALELPLEDASVDLVVTSPPYFGLRSYQDGGEHYAGQIGSEATPAEFVDALIAATAEMVRVVKPSGSIWVNLGDKYAGGGGQWDKDDRDRALTGSYRTNTGGNTYGLRAKSLIGIPWRYTIRCIDELGLILRAEVIWSKPNGLPESVTDRVRRSHETWFHFTKMPRYYSAVDEIREPSATNDPSNPSYRGNGKSNGRVKGVAAPPGMGEQSLNDGPREAQNPLGKLPGSVWTIATQPLTVPASLGIDHFAAFPMEWPRRIITGWSPDGVCTACGEGRRPVTTYTGERGREPGGGGTYTTMRAAGAKDTNLAVAALRPRVVTGYVCACTPTITVPEVVHDGWVERERTEFVFDGWTPGPATPGVVLDPFSGTGTTALMAKVLGRRGVGVDLSADYCRLARWRVNDPGQIASAMQVDKPETPMDDQGVLDFGDVA